MHCAAHSTGTTRESKASDLLACQCSNRDSLLIINFDEHGGFADHVPPPMNVPQPEDGVTFTGSSEGHQVTYDYTRLGIRCVLQSILASA